MATARLEIFVDPVAQAHGFQPNTYVPTVYSQVSFIDNRVLFELPVTYVILLSRLIAGQKGGISHMRIIRFTELYSLPHSVHTHAHSMIVFGWLST